MEVTENSFRYHLFDTRSVKLSKTNKYLSNYLPYDDDDVAGFPSRIHLHQTCVMLISKWLGMGGRPVKWLPGQK